MGMFEWVDPARNAFVRILRNAPISKLAEDGLPSQNKLREALLAMPKFDRNAKIEDESAFWNPGGMFGTFAGVNAKTANKAMLEVAQKMDKAGADRGAIWNETGWFKGPDSKWRFEIDDSKAKLNKKTWERDGPDIGYAPQVTFATDAMRHGELFKSYPDIAANEYLTRSFYNKDKAPNLSGSYSPFSGEIQLAAPDAKTMQSGLLHELQHAVQKREGFATGGGPSEFNPERATRARDVLNWRKEIDGLISKKWPNAKNEFELRMNADNELRNQYYQLGAHNWIPPKDVIAEALSPSLNAGTETRKSVEQMVKEFGLDKKTTPDDSMTMYRRLAGEAEARATQARMDMTPAERKAKPPWESYDIPWDQLIIR